MGYGFKSGAGGGAEGAKLTVNAPAGSTVTVSKDGKTKTRVADSSGVAVFNGLSTGEWTITITDGSNTATKTVTVTADYATTITFFEATINVTYPAGSVCTATDGVTTLTAPNTSGNWACEVGNAGTWVLQCVAGSNTLRESVMIDTSGQTKNVELKYYIFKDGVFAVSFGAYGYPEWIAGTQVITEGNCIRIDHHGHGQLLYYATSPLDVTGFNKLVFIIDRSYCTNEGDNGTTHYGVGSVAQSFDFNASAAVYTADAYNYPVTIDISQINGQQYVKLNNVRNAYNADILVISQIYLA